MKDIHYRNKSIFDWNDYKPNKISSITSLNIMNYLKDKANDDIKNVIIRDIENQVGIIIQTNYNQIYNLVTELNYDIKYFSFQTKFNNTFIKNKNMFIIKDDFLSFEVNYLDKKIIKLLPDSFYQANISVLDQYYENFIRWIDISKCKNMINLGDDGGNICVILSSLFDNMISYFHCESSYRCALEMIKVNKISNLKLTFDLDNIKLQNQILFINPGRKGLNRSEINFILESNIKFIIYMACNNEAFNKNIKEIKYNILECVKILSMPVINKYQFLYFCKK